MAQGTQRPKRVLLFAAKLGYQTRSFEEAAGKLGVELAYVTDRCHELEDPWGDGAVAVSFETPENAACTVMERMGGQAVDGVLAIGDRPTVAAAYAARGLGIAYNHPASEEACRNKLRMREVFREAGLPTPWFRSIPLEPIPEPALLGITYPCVLKPVSLWASQGVIRANSREEFLAAAERIGRLLENPELLSKNGNSEKRLIVEKYLPGAEVAIEGLLKDGELHVLTIFDKPDPLEGPYFEETIYVTPSRLDAETQREIARNAQDATRALGLARGPVHAEFRVNEGGVWPLEVAARPIGGLCARALRFVERSGEVTSLEELLLREAMGDLRGVPARENAASGVMMIPVPKSGILEKVEGEEEALAVGGVTELHVTARLGDFLAAWPEGSSYLGFLFAKGETPEGVEAALREAHGHLRFTITSRLPVEHPVTRKFQEAGG
jgi:biotin carboxylase